MEGEDPTVGFLRDRFSDYYSKNAPVMPPRYGSREWAFFLWEGKGMLRHTAFLSTREINGFLVKKGPRHVYHSSAYYQRPGAPTMGQKGWLGADLIFDIDADHIEGHERMTYAQMLERVKEEIIKLVIEFLMRDLAFDERYLDVVFSGGRGYHVHVRDPRVMDLNSHERKEIVDYIMATDLNTDKMYEDVAFGVSGKGQYAKAQRRRLLPRPDDPGWRGRFRIGIDSLLSELEAMEKEEAQGSLQQVEGIGKKMAEEIYRNLFEGEAGRRGVDKIRDTNTLEIFDSERPKNVLTQLVLGKNKIRAGETDAPVTRDVHRLIRLPGSLHGKSSLRVVPLSIDELKDFEPLKDAVAFGDDPVKVTVMGDMEIEIGGEKYKLKAGETELPEHAAIFLMARRGAKLDQG
jgi:DNA primase small subunit